MTDRRDLDPAPAQPWQPTSSEWARREALERTREAIRKAKERGGRA